MRKLKYILASLVLVTGLVSCETEAIDEKVKDEALEGKPILRFELNNEQTVISDKVNVEWSGDSFTIEAKVSIVNNDNMGDPKHQYKAATLFIGFSNLAIANYPTALSLENPTGYTSSAVLRILEMNDEGLEVWNQYSTDNADEKQEAGYGNISGINQTAKFLDGNFDYILYPMEGSVLKPQRLSNGNFYYIKY